VRAAYGRGGSEAAGRSAAAAARSPYHPRPAFLAASRHGRHGELRRLESSGKLSSAEHDRYRGQYDRAKQTVRRLEGARRASLGAVVDTLEDLTARGRLASSRAPVLFETLERNRQWWTEGELIGSGRRVSFAGSELVWQHYGGTGLQVQWLGTFGRAKDEPRRSGTHTVTLAATDPAGNRAAERGEIRVSR
jgi:hypothetical protein